MKLTKYILAVGAAAGVANAQEVAQPQPVFQYKQIDLNHSHIIGIPAVILSVDRQSQAYTLVSQCTGCACGCTKTLWIVPGTESKQFKLALHR